MLEASWTFLSNCSKLLRHARGFSNVWAIFHIHSESFDRFCSWKNLANDQRNSQTLSKGNRGDGIFSESRYNAAIVARRFF
jgi:hypothetical protein